MDAVDGARIARCHDTVNGAGSGSRGSGAYAGLGVFRYEILDCKHHP